MIYAVGGHGMWLLGRDTFEPLGTYTKYYIVPTVHVSRAHVTSGLNNSYGLNDSYGLKLNLSCIKCSVWEATIGQACTLSQSRHLYHQIGIANVIYLVGRGESPLLGLVGLAFDKTLLVASLKACCLVCVYYSNTKIVIFLHLPIQKLTKTLAISAVGISHHSSQE